MSSNGENRQFVGWAERLAERMHRLARLCGLLTCALLLLLPGAWLTSMEVNSYIQKPVDFQKFRETVKQMGLYWLVVNQPLPAQVERESEAIA